MSSSPRCLGQDAELSSRERNQEAANQDQMESVFQQQHVVLEIKERCGLRPSVALGIPQAVASGESLRHRAARLGDTFPSMLPMLFALQCWKQRFRDGTTAHLGACRATFIRSFVSILLNATNCKSLGSAAVQVPAFCTCLPVLPLADSPPSRASKCFNSCVSLAGYAALCNSISLLTKEGNSRAGLLLSCRTPAWHSWGPKLSPQNIPYKWGRQEHPQVPMAMLMEILNPSSVPEHHSLASH